MMGLLQDLTKLNQKMTREEAIQIVQKLLETNRLDGTGLSQVWDFLKQPITLADLLGWQEGVEYDYKDLYVLKVENNRLFMKSEKCSSGWCYYTFFGNEIENLRQAKKVEKPKPKAWRVRDEYSFKCLIEELKGLKYKNIDYDWFLIQGGDIVIYDDKNEFTHSNYNYFSMEHKDNYNLIEYHKEEPRYLLQTDLESENGVQYLSFDKKRRKYFIGALIASENVQQKFTDDEISKIKSMTRFAKLCEKVEVE